MRSTLNQQHPILGIENQSPGRDGAFVLTVCGEVLLHGNVEG